MNSSFDDQGFHGEFDTCLEHDNNSNSIDNSCKSIADMTSIRPIVVYCKECEYGHKINRDDTNSRIYSLSGKWFKGEIKKAEEELRKLGIIV